MSAFAEMPRYRCHKVVHALKIASCGYNDHGRYVITPADDGFAPFEVDQEWAVKHNPQPGGYFVVYEDGYRSFSPAAAFESGYAALRPIFAPDPELVVMIARVCHEANRAYCGVIGDESQQPWHDAPLWQQDGAINGVLHALRCPEAKPERSHENWLADKRRDGWKYGPTKDPVTKEHPCMVPYEELPLEQRTKDVLFLAIVRALAPPA